MIDPLVLKNNIRVLGVATDIMQKIALNIMGNDLSDKYYGDTVTTASLDSLAVSALHKHFQPRLQGAQK